MSTQNRREFLQSSLAAVMTAAALPAVAQLANGQTAAPAPAAAATSQPAATAAAQIVELGRSKIKSTRMAVGTGTLGAGGSSEQLRQLGPQGVADMLVFAAERGVTTWDTSDGYGTHQCIKLALKKTPREKVTIVTKTAAVSAQKLKADLDRYLKEMGTDFIDMVLLHSRTRGDWDVADKPLMDVLSEAKERKIVRAVGISIHSLPAMQAAVKSDWLDIAMVRLNPSGIRMDDKPDVVLPVVQQLKDAGKGIINIKVLGEGRLVRQIDEALTYALTKSPAQVFSLGCVSKQEFMDNVERIEKLSKNLKQGLT